jgi:hypothetical protein
MIGRQEEVTGKDVGGKTNEETPANPLQIREAEEAMFFPRAKLTSLYIITAKFHKAGEDWKLNNLSRGGVRNFAILESDVTLPSLSQVLP